ncbi:MAG: CHC2 zinc finger domain-containing protein [Acidobacteria bacterium]|nr:CHC2 zinc finger domain-containing protein [Acidobacteriota bacterium]
MRRPWEVFDQEIFPYLSLERLFADVRGLRLYGHFWHGSCPIHGDQQAAFSIDPERLEWSCSLGCGGGGPVQYLQKLRGLSWMDAARELAILAGVEPSIFDPWQEDWTEEDFLLHGRLESRSSLLGFFMTYTRSFFRSQAGQTVRSHLITRQGFPEEKLKELDLGLYTAPEDVWHCLKKTGRDLEEVRSWGLFEAHWSGRIVGCWKDLQGRRINVWGWQPKENSTGQACSEGRILFEQGDALGGKSVPFNLDVAACLEKRDLLLLEGPIEALFTQFLGLDDPFPVAAGGDLNSLQIEAMQDHLRFGGKLTVCWDYNPETAGTKKDRAFTTLQRLKKANFPIFVVDPALMADHSRPKQKVTVNDFIVRHGGGEQGLQALRELLEKPEKYEAEIVVEGTALGNRSGIWPGVLEIFHSFSSRNSRASAPADEDEIVSGRLQALEPMFKAAEEIGRSIAKGFLGGLPKGLTKKLTGEASNGLQLASHSTGELAGLPVQISSPPTFSVDRLGEETRAAPMVKLSGWRALDNLEVRFNPGELAVLGGRTGHGKTSMLLGLLLEWLEKATVEGTDKLFLFYSVEEPEVRIYHRLLSLLTARNGKGWTIHQIEDYLKEKNGQPVEHWSLDPETLEAAEGRLHSWEECLQLLYQPTWTIADLETYARTLAESRKVGAILVDHLQRIPPPRGTHGRRDVEISTVAHRLKTLAVDLSCPIVTTAQIGRQALQRAQKIPPNKPLGDVNVLGAIKMRRPQLQHLREGGIEQEADLVLGLLNYAADYQSEMEEPGSITATTPFEVGTLKNRYGPVGCWASLRFQGRFGLLQDPDRCSKEDGY